MEHHLNLPGVTVWYALSSHGLIGQFFYEGNVNGMGYFNLQQESVMSRILKDFYDENFDFLNIIIVALLIILMKLRRVKQDLTPLDLFSCGFHNNKVYLKYIKTVAELRIAIEKEYEPIPVFFINYNNMCFLK